MGGFLFANEGVLFAGMQRGSQRTEPLRNPSLLAVPSWRASSRPHARYRNPAASFSGETTGRFLFASAGMVFRRHHAAPRPLPLRSHAASAFSAAAGLS
jgi:hypothetical protein